MLNSSSEPTTMVRVAGVGSAAPRASMQVKVTVKVPAVVNVTGPGLVPITSGASLPKVHRAVKGVVWSGSIQAPWNVTAWPTRMVVVSLIGAVMVESGIMSGTDAGGSEV